MFTASDASSNMHWKVIPAEGGEARTIAPELRMGGLFSPSFSPDGKHLAFTGVRNKGEVWVVKNLLPEMRAAR